MIDPLRGVARLARGIDRVLHWRTPLLLHIDGSAAFDNMAPSLGAWLGRTRGARFEAVATPAGPDAVGGRVEIAQRSPDGKVLASTAVELGTGSVSVRVALTDAEGSSIQLPRVSTAGVALWWEAPALVRRRALGELARLTRGAVSQYGWRGLPRRLMLAPGRDDRRAYLAWVEKHRPDAATLARWRHEALAWP